MDHEFHRFQTPIHIYTRLPFASLIWTVPQALAFLKICHPKHHTAEFFIALGACSAAIEREAPAAWARETFRQFADQGDMLLKNEDEEDIDLDTLFSMQRLAA